VFQSRLVSCCIQLYVVVVVCSQGMLRKLSLHPSVQDLGNIPGNIVRNASNWVKKHLERRSAERSNNNELESESVRTKCSPSSSD